MRPQAVSSGGCTREGVTRVDDVRRVIGSAVVFEPAAAADYVELAIAVDVGLGQPFVFVEGFEPGVSSSLFYFAVAAPGVDLRGLPGFGGAGVRGNLGNVELAGALVPEYQLRSSVAVEVTE